MSSSRTNRLDQDKLVKCPQCGEPTWHYRMQSGNRVALDSAPGPYIIDANNIAYRSEGTGGYRGHFDHCRLGGSSLATQVEISDFLWP